ncbi:MAG: hypothetical protein AD742_01090 [Methylibium sp. NZG]|nr:MAG: hypothetical protein AD742_01090 [Methylibium sp. NZG]
MHKTLLAVSAALAVTSIPTVALAQASPLSFNVSVTSDYRYRGISQTRLKPAIQGGVDYALPAGFYVGAWASTIKWIEDAGGDAKIEIDLYGGYKGEITKDLSFDVGLLQYIYPGAKTAAWNAAYKDPNTTEAYGALTYGPATVKASVALTDLFGNYDFAGGNSSKGSVYLEASAGLDVGAGITLTPRLGYQKVRNIANASYTDFALTASKDFSGFLVSAGIVGTDANKSFYVPGFAANSTKFLGKTGAVVSVKYSF